MKVAKQVDEKKKSKTPTKARKGPPLWISMHGSDHSHEHKHKQVNRQ